MRSPLYACVPRFGHGTVKPIRGQNGKLSWRGYDQPRASVFPELVSYSPPIRIAYEIPLQPQQAAITAFCAQHNYKIEAEYREVETGKGADALERRPELATAMKHQPCMPERENMEQ